MKALVKWSVSLSALVGVWTVLVADSTGEFCGASAAFQVTYDFATDCMGPSTTGRFSINEAAADGPFGFNREQPVSDTTLQNVKASGLNAMSIMVRHDSSKCDQHSGIARPVGFTFLIYGVPVGDAIIPADDPAGSPPTPTFECSDNQASTLAADVQLTCTNGSGRYGSFVPAKPCSLSLTFVGP